MEEKKLMPAEQDFRKGNLECVGGPIDLEKVRLWTGNYRKANHPEVTTSHFFGRLVIEKILRQPGCVGIRMHYAVDDRGRKQLVLSGVNRIGQDQLPKHFVRMEEHNLQQQVMPAADATAGGNLNEEEFSFYDQSWPCPETKGCPQ